MKVESNAYESNACLAVGENIIIKIGIHPWMLAYFMVNQFILSVTN